jgi:hypothetical protein
MVTKTSKIVFNGFLFTTSGDIGEVKIWDITIKFTDDNPFETCQEMIKFVKMDIYKNILNTIDII